MDDLLADFLTETQEALGELDIALVTLERTPDDQETLSKIFRLVHTIKGTCGFLGLSRLEKVAHAAENVLGRMRDGAIQAESGVIGLVLQSIDRIKDILAGLAAGGAEPPGGDEELIAALDAVAAGERPPAPSAPSAASAEAPATAVAAGEMQAAESPSAEEPAALPHPPPPSSPPIPAPPAAGLAEAETPPPAGAKGGEAEPHRDGEAVVNQTIRVSVEVLEHLMTLVSELVLTRNQLLQLARTEENNAFSVPLQRLSHITSDLQEGVMKTRMQPIGNAWNKLPRLVRDLAHELGKKIDLVMIGQDTELDRQVLELIKDPLTHMVRNSADHGLEPPETRRALGKPEAGRITLNAYHEGGHIIIEISDDGRGLDLERIRAKALAQGLVSEAELAAMNESQILRFIFHPGFSTAAQVTAVSGRGVGMDVVKTNIERIGGTIDLKTVAGQGTTFTIKIPLTLAIVAALIVEAGGERFAIPQISVVELVRATTEAKEGTDQPVIERINTTPVLRLRDHLLPLVNLRDILGLEASQEEGREFYVVVVQVGVSQLGLIVDRVFDTEEIVVKPVAPILRHITLFSGNTILGDGSVIMILDPTGIARATGVTGSEQRVPESESGQDHATSEEAMAILIFRAGDATPKAVPLGLVARLEDIPREKIESSAGRVVTQYRGQLMPLVAFDGVSLAGESQPTLVFTDGSHSMGLMVDEIIDVVEEPLKIELGTAVPGLLGKAVIAGRATDVIDTDYWLRLGVGEWHRAGHGAGPTPGTKGPHILVVEDSAFFRHLLIPALAMHGYRVTAVESAQEALRLRDGGLMVDAIISDIVMPDPDGYAFARKIREGGAWVRLPLIALSSHTDPEVIEAAREAGFSDFVAKLDRDALLASLEQCLGGERYARRAA